MTRDSEPLKQYGVVIELSPTKKHYFFVAVIFGLNSKEELAKNISEILVAYCFSAQKFYCCESIFD